MRTATVLLGVWILSWGIAARADQPETFERGTGKYILVLKDPRTDVDDPATGKKKAKEPDVVKHGGKVLYRKENTRVIKLPVQAARALSEEENVAYLQRIWLGESAAEWAGDGVPSSIKADSVLDTQETNLTWETGQYLYDGSGNIRRIGDDTYEYDTLGRLKKAVINGITATYQYDAFGNLVEQKVDGVTRLTPVDAASNRLLGETYDAAGNLTTHDRTPAYHYDSFSMIDRVQKRRTGVIIDQRYLYGPDDERIGTVREEGVRTRWTIRDFGGKVLTEYEANDENGFWTWSRDYVYGDGRLLGSDRHEYFGGQRHVHLDHLGTVRMITNQLRQRISVHEFYPFGVEQTDATQEHNRLVPGLVGSAPDFRSEPMKFTGHERDWHGWLNVDNDEYLDYMHARYYDPNLGRFLSVDPVLDLKAAMTEPQMWNRYSYVTNNPLKFTDPDGRYRTFYNEKPMHTMGNDAPPVIAAALTAPVAVLGAGAASYGAPAVAQLGLAVAVRFPNAVNAVQNFLAGETGSPTIGGFSAAKSAVSKADDTGAKFGMSGGDLVKSVVANGAKFVDQKNGTINVFMARPDGKSGFVRVTLDAKNKVVSVGLNSAANVRNGLKEERYIPYNH